MLALLIGPPASTFICMISTYLFNFIFLSLSANGLHFCGRNVYKYVKQPNTCSSSADLKNRDSWKGGGKEKKKQSEWEKGIVCTIGQIIVKEAMVKFFPCVIMNKEQPQDHVLLLASVGQKYLLMYTNGAVPKTKH